MRTDLQQMMNNDDALRKTLRKLPRHSAPAGMTSRLRAVATQDRIRRQQPRLSQRVWHGFRDRTRLAFENFMRPLAVPALGGVFSAVTLFNLWVVPAFPLQPRPGTDVPTQLNTQAESVGNFTIWGAPGTFAVDVLVDDRGRVVDYSIVPGRYVPDELARRNLKDLLVVYRRELRPATKFGQPIMGKVRLQFSSVQVKG